LNFLAHLYLSGADPKVKIGNFIGDFVKGRNLSEQFEAGIVKGIALHREIDAFTDRHPVVRESKIRLRPKYRHYSPVIIDVFYDHFLAANWANYSDQLLADFARDSYNTLEKYQALLPDQVNQMLPYMIKGNWLVGYSQVEGIHRALSGMARRTPYESKMEEATADLQLYYSEFQDEFDRFFPELKEFATQWIATNR
jgi:acyl carrier protein phosphodiesterase